MIISNRLALKKQVTNHLAGKDDNEDQLIHYDDIIDVITYQALLRKKIQFEKDQKNRRKYLYVICDEAHFFTSDAMFNPDTERILSSIVSVFKNSIRIYMSATPYECLSYIVDVEEKQQKMLYDGNDNLMYNKIALYHFDRDYSYLDVEMYSHIDELCDEIVSSITHKKRWLIFIDNKSKCSTLKKKLNKMYEKNMLEEETLETTSEDTPKEKTKPNKNMIIAVDADSKNVKDYASLINNEILGSDTYVLISTSVLDNGINLKNIDNIVISDSNIVKCLQMVGRARLNKDAESNNNDSNSKRVYIKRFDVKYVSNKVCEYKDCKTAYHKFDLTYGKSAQENELKKCEYEFLSRYYDGYENDWKIAKRLFGRDFNEPTKLYLNNITRKLVKKRLKIYHLILNEMKQEKSMEKFDGKIYVGQGYLEYQLSWFRKKYCEDKDLTLINMKEAMEQLFSFLKECSKSNIVFESPTQRQNRKGSTSEDDTNMGNQAEFRKKFTELYKPAVGKLKKKDKNQNRAFGIEKINACLLELNLPFKVESIRSVGWIVKPMVPDKEDGEK